MRILVTGGTGFIGRELCKSLKEDGHQLTVLSRDPGRVTRLLGDGVKPLADLKDWGAGEAYDAIINLSGAPIMARHWTKARKQVLIDSRVTLTDSLVKAMACADVKPSVFISGSAIGYFGDQGDTPLDENHSGGSGFAHDLCQAWEQAARGAEALGIRTCLLRTGLVVGRHGGFLQQMLPAFRFGLGGRIGSGTQWMSWIHLSDEIGIIRFLLDNQKAIGVFNATAPQPVTNLEFTKTLATQLHRPTLFTVPAWLLKFTLGEMAELLLGSQRVLPVRVQETGYRFRYETLDVALQDVLKD